jgi:hypothetical protein
LPQQQRCRCRARAPLLQNLHLGLGVRPVVGSSLAEFGPHHGGEWG